jgi:CheY-like chemotaxis protein
LFFAGEYEVTEQNYWHLLFVDDSTENCDLADKYLNERVVLEPGDKFKVTTEVDFNKALDRLESGYFDFVVLDVRLGPHEEEREEEEGIKVLESIKARCFIPVIFYTGLPQKVRHLETPLIKVLENTEGLPKLLSIVKEILSTGIPLVNRELLRHVKEVQRDYMWEFIANNWGAFEDTPDRTSLAYLLARRLAKSLDSPGIQKLAEKLGDTAKIWCSEDNVHPMRYYIVPPLGIRPMAGDVIKEEDGTKTKYMVLITPSCDFVQGKVDHMLFAYCTPLREIKEYIDWEKNPDDPDQKYISRLLPFLTDKKERFFFLPSVFNIPDLIVDYQKVTKFEPQEFTRLMKEGKLTCVASLDSPYCENLCARFSRYFGRIGTPDLNIDLIVKRIKGEKNS